MNGPAATESLHSLLMLLAEVRVWTVEGPGRANCHGACVSCRRPWQYATKSIALHLNP